MMRLTGPSNFRPLPLVRPQTLFRSDHLGALDEGDVRQIRALGITRVLDFRGVNERADAVCGLADVTVHSLAIEPTVVQQLNLLLDAGRQVEEADVVALMRDTYRGFVRTSSNRFAEFFSHLLESNQPTVFHCTAGKDRTGFAAALVLHALGASQDEVMRDYLLTNELHKPHWLATTRLPQHVAQVLARVQPEFLHAAFEAVEEDYGSLDAYLRSGLGLGPFERERLARLYT
jgi:protein-tyrosine phosphatase